MPLKTLGPLKSHMKPRDAGGDDVGGDGGVDAGDHALVMALTHYAEGARERARSAPTCTFFETVRRALSGRLESMGNGGTRLERD